MVASTSTSASSSPHKLNLTHLLPIIKKLINGHTSQTISDTFKLCNMGQYYRFIFLSESNEILHWIDSYCKMMEFAWQHCDNRGGLCEAAEAFIAGPASTNRYHLVCAGDYGAPEPNTEKNLYHMCDDLPDLKIKPDPANGLWYPYIVNHTRKEFVDKRRNSEHVCKRDGEEMIHPLPLLVSETAGGGGGDYRGTNECDVGIWARDVITMERERPGEDYKEFVVGFREC